MSQTLKTVAVTGASGYLASHLVKKLLAKGFKVHGTVRDPTNAAKVAHLKALPHSERLILFKADLTESGSFSQAFAGTEAVFHTASPFFYKNVTDPQKQLIEPAVQGTENVLAAIKNDPGKTIKTVVVTSSCVSLIFGPPKPEGYVFTESDWSDEEWMKANAPPYPLSKTLAERAVWKWAESTGNSLGIRTVVVNPAMMIGPLLQPEMNTSSEAVLNYLNGSLKEIPRMAVPFVDVRDVADVHIRAYEESSAQGRYITVIDSKAWEDVAEIIRKIRPNAPIPTALAKGDKPRVAQLNPAKTEKLLGRKFISLEQSLRDTIDSLEQNGFAK